MTKRDDDDGVIQLIKLAESYGDIAVEEAPAPKPPREDWLRQRKRGIGGSEVGAILGVDPYRTPLDVYLDKISDEISTDDNSHRKRGRKMEALIAQEYSELHPEDSLMEVSGRCVHPKHEWMVGNPDRYIISARHADKGRGIMEIKCPARPLYERMKLEGVPSRYILQMQHYLAITGLKWGTFVIFNADAWEMMVFEVEAWDKEAMDNLIDLEADFWKNHVIPRNPPKVEVTRIELPKVGGTLVSRTDDLFHAAVKAHESAKQTEKEAKELVEAAKKAVLDVINSEPGVYESDQYRVYYTAQEGRRSLDKKALAFARPLDRTAVGLLLAGGYEADELAIRIAGGEADLDISKFEKQGDDFTTLRIYKLNKGNDNENE